MTPIDTPMERFREALRVATIHDTWEALVAAFRADNHEAIATAKAARAAYVATALPALVDLARVVRHDYKAHDFRSGEAALDAQYELQGFADVEGVCLPPDLACDRHDRKWYRARTRYQRGPRRL